MPMSSSTRNDTYYDKGSEEPATETPLTIQKLAKRRHLTANNKRTVIVLVGLPGRGKSFVARKLSTFLTWRGGESKVFNVGLYRRHAVMLRQETESSSGACDADFFDSSNEGAAAIRHEVAELAMKDMLKWLDMGIDDDDSSSSTSMSVTSAKDRVAIFDATNSTKQRRQWVLEQCTSPVKRMDKPTGVVFVESICDDEELLEENFRFKVSNSPDYEGMSTEVALQDLRKRVQNYEASYETITDDSQSYIKIFNLSSKLMVNHIYGRMAKTIVPALMAWNIGTRPVFLCRAGSTPHNLNGDSFHSFSELVQASPVPRRNARGNKLGVRGMRFRDDLCHFIQAECTEFIQKRNAMEATTTGTSMTGISSKLIGDVGSDGQPLPFPCVIMSSTMPRAVQTVTWESPSFQVEQQSALNPLDKGDFGGMELEEIRKREPEWYARLEEDPFHTRFPGGESYSDLIKRLEPVIIDIEQQVAPVVVASHVSIIQMLMAYFRNSPVEKCTSIEVPMHTVMKFTPVQGGGWSESSYTLHHPRQEDIPLLPLSRGSDSSFSDISEDGHSPPIWGDPPMQR